VGDVKPSLKQGRAPATLIEGDNKVRAGQTGAREKHPLKPRSKEDTPQRPPAREIVPASGTYHLRRGQVVSDRVGEPPERLRDRLIVRQVLAGDRERFSLLMDRYRERIFALTRRMVGNEAEAEDLMQQTFTEAFEALERFDQRRRFRTWLFRIATNNCLDFLKSHRRLEHPTGDSGEYEAAMFAGRMDASPEQWLHTTRRLSRALIALKELKPKYRLPVILKDLEGLSYEEIQEVMDLPQGTLRIRVHRGRARIRELLKRLEGQ